MTATHTASGAAGGRTDPIPDLDLADPDPARTPGIDALLAGLRRDRAVFWHGPKSRPGFWAVLGYDARVQLLHEEDALAVLERATAEDCSGVFNVGGEDVLLLSQALRRAGRLPLPVPLPAVAYVSRLFRQAALVDFSPEQMRFLNFGRVVDITRLKTRFGFTPRWTTVQAFDDFVSGGGLRPLIDPRRLAAAERAVLAKLRS